MTFDVAIIGFGPVGALLTGLLGKLGLRVLVIEKEEEVFPLPRAAHVDHTGLRNIQEVGCLDEILAKSVRNKSLDILNADLEVLLSIRADQESVSGLPTSVYFYQPEFDTILRDKAASYPGVELRLGVEMTALKDASGHVDIITRTKDGRSETYRALWVVGCDGAHSPVRELMGIKLNSLNFDEQWLVVDLLLNEAPKGLPMDHAIEICDPKRPYLSTPIAHNRQRFEFMLLAGEDAAKIKAESFVRGLLKPWLPEGKYSVERSATYTFHGVVAETWRKGRVFLAGDAAHQTPPFLGQGMCAGFRDASNLAWKLARIIKDSAPDHLLDTYEAERSPHAVKVIESAIRIGEVICELDPRKAESRNRALLARDPAVFQSLAFSLPPLEDGPLIRSGGGRLFLQTEIGGRMLDDIIGSRFFVLARSTTALGASAEWWRTQMGAYVTTLADLPLPQLADWLARDNADVLVVRPDRYVLGTSQNLDTLTDAVAALLAPATAESVTT